MRRQHGQPAPADPNAETFLAFSRVFSGVAREGATVQVFQRRKSAGACQVAAVEQKSVRAEVELSVRSSCSTTLGPTNIWDCAPPPQVLSAAYSPARPGEQRQEARIAGLYLMMGRGLERLQVRFPTQRPVF